MVTTNGSSQFLRLPDGSRALFCAYDYSLHHPNTDQMTSGVYSYRFGKWFSSTFNYNMYMFKNNLGPYEDPKYRSEMKVHLEETERRCCDPALIEFRKDKYFH